LFSYKTYETDGPGNFQKYWIDFGDYLTDWGTQSSIVICIDSKSADFLTTDMKPAVLAALSSTGNPAISAYRTINGKAGCYGYSYRNSGHTDYYAFFPISQHVVGIIATRDNNGQFFDIMDSISIR
jgi:hypothetical protein